MPLLVYSLLRLALVGVCWAVLVWVGLNPWAAVVVAALVAWGLSYVALARPRDAAARWLADRAARRRGTSPLSARARRDEDDEDALVEAQDDERPAAAPGERRAGTTDEPQRGVPDERQRGVPDERQGGMPDERSGTARDDGPEEAPGGHREEPRDESDGPRDESGGPRDESGETALPTSGDASTPRA